MEELGGRVTIGDIAAQAGVKTSEAEEALNALAADSSASIQVCCTSLNLGNLGQYLTHSKNHMPTALR